MPLWVHETHPVPVRVDEGANIHKVPFEWEIKVDVIGPPVRPADRMIFFRRSKDSCADP